MSDARVVRGRLIKWDGEAPKVWKWKWRWPFLYRDIPEPIGHPKCAEIIDFDSRSATVTYKRN